MFREDKIKIGDFGLATEDSQDAEDPMERTVGKGTKRYMAPEQVQPLLYIYPFTNAPKCLITCLLP